MNTLETQVLELIGEDTDSPDVFTDTSDGMAQIRESLNDAIEEISMLTGANKRDYQLPLTANSTFYRMRWTEEKFAWVTDAWLVGQRRRLEQTDLIRLKNFNPLWMQDSGPPQSYFQIGLDIIGYWPKTTSDNDVVSLTCVSIPDRYLEGIDRIKLRDEYKWAAVYFAVGEYYASRGDAKSAIMWHKKYMEKVGLQEMYPMSAERQWYYKTNKEPWPKNTE